MVTTNLTCYLLCFALQFWFLFSLFSFFSWIYTAQHVNVDARCQDYMMLTCGPLQTVKSIIWSLVRSDYNHVNGSIASPSQNTGDDTSLPPKYARPLLLTYISLLQWLLTLYLSMPGISTTQRNGGHCGEKPYCTKAISYVHKRRILKNHPLRYVHIGTSHFFLPQMLIQRLRVYWLQYEIRCDLFVMLNSRTPMVNTVTCLGLWRQLSEIHYCKCVCSQYPPNPFVEQNSEEVEFFKKGIFGIVWWL